MNNPLTISEGQVSELLKVQDSINLAREAYIRVAKHQALNPERAILSILQGTSIFAMPAHIFGHKTSCVKVARVNRRNREKQLPSVMATVYAYDSSTGLELARVEADALTALRTAASTAVATDLLAAKDCETLGIIGSGKQARAHVPALLAVRRFSRILVYSPDLGHRVSFATDMTRAFHVPTTPAESPEKVAASSQVLVLATNSPTPLFRGGLVQPGTHVNAVGAALPGDREVDSFLVEKSFLVVDSADQAKSSYGDILIPLREGAIRESDLRELGELLISPAAPRWNRNGTTLFKSGGLAVLDCLFAERLITLVSKGTSRTRTSGSPEAS